MKQLVIPIFALLFGSFIFTACTKGKAAGGDDAKNEKFVLSDSTLKKLQTATVQSQAVMGEVTLNAKIAADPDKTVQVFPLVGGNVTEVNVELGQYVAKGAVLAIIKSSEIADNDRQRIEAQSDLAAAQKALSSTRDMYEGKLASERDLFSAQKEVEKAQAGLNRANEVSTIYGTNSKSLYTVRAPIAGFITQKNVAKDMSLRSDANMAIFTISQINEVFVVANVYEADISHIKVGETAQISILSYPDKAFTGKIDQVFNLLDPESKTMKVRVRLPNPDFQLKPEMNATVHIKYGEAGAVMTAVPSAAVIFDKSQNFVMIYKDKFNIETRPVDVYRQVGETTYIKSGVKDGEKVMTKEQLFVYDALND
jgi:membrane fusion protein, heavy metal efflux system